MARFITYSGRTATGGEVFDRNLEGILTAYTIYLGLPLILNFTGDYIKSAPLMLRFFRKWKLTDEYFTQVEKADPRSKPYGSWQSYRDAVLATLPYHESLYNRFNPRSSLGNVELYKHGSILLMYNIYDVNEAETAVDIGNKLDATTSSDVLFTTQFESIIRANPFIALETRILFAYIYLLQVYRDYSQAQEAKGVIPPFLQHQTAKAILDNELKKRGVFDSYGRFTVAVPKSEVKDPWLTLDTYGLKLTTSITPTAPGEPYARFRIRLPSTTHLSRKLPRVKIGRILALVKAIPVKMPATALTHYFSARKFYATIKATLVSAVIPREVAMKVKVTPVVKKSFTLKVKATRI